MEPYMIEQIKRILNAIDKKHPNVNPTFIYNEEWLIKLVLLWYNNHRKNDSLPFVDSAIWFSEPRLISPFVNKKLKCGETHTHSDGVIGNFNIGTGGRKSNLEFIDPFEEFIVLEAKIFSELSKKITNDPDYDQVARTVACMSYIIWLKTKALKNIKLGFYILAPKFDEKGKNNKLIENYNSYLNVDRVKEKIENRYKNYEKANKTKIPNEIKSWYEFFPDFIERIKGDKFFNLIYWENIIDEVEEKKDATYAICLKDFLKKCKRYNSKNADKEESEQ
jgi:hypothetical protein